MKAKFWDTILLILKIALPLILLIPLAVFSYNLVESRIFDLQNQGEPGYHSGYMFYGFVSFLLLLLTNLGAVILTGIGRLIAQFCRSSSKRARHIKFFNLFFLAPFVSQLLYVLELIVLSFVD